MCFHKLLIDTYKHYFLTKYIYCQNIDLAMAPCQWVRGCWFKSYLGKGNIFSIRVPFYPSAFIFSGS